MNVRVASISHVQYFATVEGNTGFASKRPLSAWYSEIFTDSFVGSVD